MSLVSVILPNYNHAPFLEQRIASIIGQTHQEIELIILDDASTDDSRKILEQYRRHPKVAHIVYNEHNSGSPFSQWKKGLALATGEYIWIAESDDDAAPTLLETLLPLFKDGVGLAYVQTIDVDSEGKELLHRATYTKEFVPNVWEQDFRMEGKAFVENYLLVKNVIPNASAVVFKKSLVSSDVFKTSLLNMRMCGDWWFWIQLCQATNIAFTATPLNYFRNHSTVTRKHNTKAKKKQRLVEEYTLRKNSYESNHWSHQKMERKLYHKWFRLHGLSAIFTKSFYQIKNIQNGKPLVVAFLKSKLRKN